MPLTQIDPVPALIVIDMQKGIVGLPVAHPIEPVISGIAALCKAFRAKKFSVVLVNVDGRAPGRTDSDPAKFDPPPGWTDFIPELEQSPDDFRVTKKRLGAFLGTNLGEYLKKKNVTQVFMTGVVTSIGVESTARSAYDLGYNVVFITDAMTDLNLEAHERGVNILFPRMGECAAAADVLKMLKS